jgi:hypothetical protein
VRGGIAYSQHFQSNHLTYSHAVWRAYELESSVAVYPRIVLDKNVVDMYEVASDLPPIRSRNLLCVENGVFFLDVLTRDNWTEVYDYARKIYESNRDQQVHSSRKVFTSINSCSNRSGRVRCGN